MKHPDLIFDVGLHRGEDSDFYLRKGFRVVAFEADPENADFCRGRFRGFINEQQLTIIEGAIIDPATLKPGQRTVSFFKNDGVSVWGTVRSDWAQRNEECGASSRLIQVEVVDFAAALRQHGIPHYLKVDIEGCDLVCVRALKGFADRPNYVSFESDKTSLERIKAEIDLLSELGYERFQAVEQSSVGAQLPPSPAREGKYVKHKFEEGCSGLFGAELGDCWRSRKQIIRQYRLIRLAYYLLGDNGLLRERRSRCARHLALCVQRVLERLTGAAVPGWFDTHARLDLKGTRSAG